VPASQTLSPPSVTESRVTVLGVNCSTDCAYLAVSSDGELRADSVELVSAPALGESSEQLLAVLDELKRVVGEVEAERVVLLRPEGGRMGKRTHSEHVPRIALETLVRLAAVETGRSIELLARPTLRSRLKLPTEGKLVTHLSSRIPEKVGSNWSEERQLAALAALAGEAGA
jgi:hypothetical protein